MNQTRLLFPKVDNLSKQLLVVSPTGKAENTLFLICKHVLHSFLFSERKFRAGKFSTSKQKHTNQVL